MDIFVGNLSFEATGEDIKRLFEGFGNVASAVIVMRKEKKAPKSRGFGFVQMPDEQQAHAAITALNGNEFMGRVLNINPARPKVEAKAESELKQNRQPKVEVEAEQYPRPFFNKPKRHKLGRRTQSYMKRKSLSGKQEEIKPWRRGRDNPMRWRKRKGKAKPWQKSPGEHKPWEKAAGGEAKPWKKAEGEPKPWSKPEGGNKPWKKSAGDAKPWSKSSGHPEKSRFRGRRKFS